jgi:hypothetical protein
MSIRPGTKRQRAQLGEQILASLVRAPKKMAQLRDEFTFSQYAIRERLLSLQADNLAHCVQVLSACNGKAYIWHAGPVPDSAEPKAAAPKEVRSEPARGPYRDPLTAALFGPPRQDAVA